jgi:hypothetical protein
MDALMALARLDFSVLPDIFFLFPAVLFVSL